MDVELTWPPEDLRTDRLVVRAPGEQDRDALRSLYTDESAMEHLGGARSPEQLDAQLGPEALGRVPGSWVLTTHDGDLVGTLLLDRRAPERPGHVPGSPRPELEISWIIAPEHWGQRYAAEAARAVLAAVAPQVPDGRVVAVAPVADGRSMRVLDRLGFEEIERFEERGAEHVLLVRPLFAAPLHEAGPAAPEER